MSESGHEEPVRWGRSATAWYVVAVVAAALVVTFATGGVAGAFVLAGGVVGAGVIRALVPRSVGLTSRSRALDAALLLGVGAALGAAAFLVPVM